jgi:ABC-type multidrug transport system fused ATPase/permease subunit
MNQIIIKVLQILTKQQMVRLRPILGLTFIVSLFEILVIGAIVPILLLLTNPSIAREKIAHLTGQTRLILSITDGALIWGTIGIFSILLVIKTLLSILLAYKQSKYIYHVQGELSRDILKATIQQPFTKIQATNSATHIQLVINETNAFTHLALIPISILITEISAVALIVAGIFILAPYGAILICVLFGLPAYFYYRISKNKLVELGEKRLFLDNSKLKTTKEIFGAIKEVKLYNSTNFFLNKFYQQCFSSAQISHMQGFIHSLPRYIFEFFSIASIIALISAFIVLGYDRTEIISVVGLFGGAAFRLMPSINRVFNSTGNLKFAKQTIDSIHTSLQSHNLFCKRIELSKLEFNKSIQIKNLTYRYEGTDNNIFMDNHIEINKGEVVAIMGTSGSGKTTLIGIIMGLLEPKNMLFLVDGNIVDPADSSWQQRIAYVPQEIYLLDDTIEANITFGESLESRNKARFNNAIASAELSQLLADQTDIHRQSVGENGGALSGGQKQRIGIARALYADGKDILILDEATSALDMSTEKKIIENIKNLSKQYTIILITHRPAALDISNRVIKLPLEPA